MCQLSRRQVIGTVAAAVAVMSVSETESAQIDESNVIKHETGKITQLHIQNGGLSFILNNMHFYTGDEPLLHSALLAAFASDVRVTVGIWPTGAKPFFNVKGEKTGESRMASSVILERPVIPTP